MMYTYFASRRQKVKSRMREDDRSIGEVRWRARDVENSHHDTFDGGHGMKACRGSCHRGRQMCERIAASETTWAGLSSGLQNSRSNGRHSIFWTYQSRWSTIRAAPSHSRGNESLLKRAGIPLPRRHNRRMEKGDTLF